MPCALKSRRSLRKDPREVGGEVLDRDIVDDPRCNHEWEFRRSFEADAEVVLGELLGPIFARGVFGCSLGLGLAYESSPSRGIPVLIGFSVSHSTAVWSRMGSLPSPSRGVVFASRDGADVRHCDRSVGELGNSDSPVDLESRGLRDRKRALCSAGDCDHGRRYLSLCNGRPGTRAFAGYLMHKRGEPVRIRDSVGYHYHGRCFYADAELRARVRQASPATLDRGRCKPCKRNLCRVGDCPAWWPTHQPPLLLLSAQSQ